MCNTELIHSDLIIRNAAECSLVSIVRMAKARKNKTNAKQVQKIMAIWKQAKQDYYETVLLGKPDFLIIQNAEKNMRKLYLELIWIRGHQYGFTEDRRIHRESEGEMGPINRALNIGGAEMRGFGVLYYPLPMKEKLAKSDIPIKISHPKLPSLDLIEVLRCHMIELAFTMCLYDVPFNTMSKYFQAFFQDCRPILDWIYAGGRRGVNSKSKTVIRTENQSGFKLTRPQDLDRILTAHKDRIRHEYVFIGRKLSVTSLVENNDDRISSVDNQQTKNIGIRSYDNLDEQSKRDLFLEQLDIKEETPGRQFISSLAIEAIIDKAASKAKHEGTKNHKFLLNGLPNPYKLKNFFDHPERYETQLKNVYFLGEVDISNESAAARADTAMAVKFKDKMLPLVVIDYKTRNQLFMDYYGKQSRSNPNLISPRFTISKGVLDNDSWQFFRTKPITKTEEQQLQAYSKHIYDQFNQKYKLDRLSFAPITCVIRIKAETSSSRIKGLQQFVYSAILHFISNLSDFTSSSSYVISNDEYELALHLDPESVSRVLSVLGNTKYSFHNPQNQPEPPKLQGKSRSGETILYLHHNLGEASGKSAAFIATVHHLIPSVVKEREGSIAILDVMNMFSQFQDCRMRMNKKLKKSMESLSVISWDEFYYTHIIPEIERFDNYIILGWDQFQEASLLDYNEIERLEKQLIDSLPIESNVYLVDRARMDVQTSQKYQSRTLTNPIASYRLNYISKVIYNLPTVPKSIQDLRSKYEDQRVIIEWQNKLHKSLVPIIPLRRYSERFLRRNTKGKNLPTLTVKRNNAELKKALLKDSEDLLPWLFGISPDHLRFEANLVIDTNPLMDVHEPWDYPWPNNLRFQERKNLPKKWKPKSMINGYFRQFLQDRFSEIEIIQTIQPLNPSLLYPKLNSQYERECAEWIRLRKMIKFLKNQILGDIKGITSKRMIDSSKISNKSKNIILSLLSEIGKSQSLEKAKTLITSWDKKYQFLLWQIFKDEADTKHNLYKTSEISSLIDETFFQNYGLSNYLILMILHILYPEADRSIFIMTLKRLHSHTLQMLGFYPMRQDLPRTRYQTSLVFYNSLQFFQSNLEKTNLSEPKGSNGWIFTTQSYSWVDIPGYDPILVENDRHRVFFDSIYHSYSAIIDREIISEIIDNFDDHESKSLVGKFPILVVTKTKDSYLWCKQFGNWICLGKINLFTIKGSKKESILTGFTLRRVKNQVSEYDEPNTEFDLKTKLEKLALKSDLMLILSPKLMIDENNIEEISIGYFLESDEDPLITESYSFTSELIQKLREISNGNYTIEYSEEFFRVDREIEWEFSGKKHWDLSCLIPYVRQSSKVALTLPTNVIDLIEFIEDNNIIPIVYNIIHDTSKCVACNASLLEAFNQTQYYKRDFQGWRLSSSKFNHEYKDDNKLYQVQLMKSVKDLPVSLRNMQGELTSQNIFYNFIKPYYYEDGLFYEPLFNEFRGSDEFELTEDNFYWGEDYWLRRLAKERYGSSIPSRPPGLEKLRGVWILTSIDIYDNTIRITFDIPHESRTIVEQIPGNATNECYRINDWENGLANQMNSDLSFGELTALEVFEQHDDYWRIKKLIDNHKINCPDHDSNFKGSFTEGITVEYDSMELKGDFIELKTKDAETGESDIDHRSIWEIGNDPQIAFNSIFDSLMEYFDGEVNLIEFGDHILNNFSGTMTLSNESVDRRNLFDNLIWIMDELDDQAMSELDENDKFQVSENNQEKMRILENKFTEYELSLE